MMCKEDWFGIVRWCDDDIRTALEDAGKEVNDENVSKIRQALDNHWFTDYMIEHGWEYINETVRNELRDDCAEDPKPLHQQLIRQEDVFSISTTIFDEEEIIPHCTVQVWKNSVTGEVDIGWWREDE